METEIAIIGVGPAGLQAAIHAARKKVKVIAIGKNDGSALRKAEIENYFGIPSKEGPELLKTGREQAERFGAQLLDQEVLHLKKEGEEFVILTDHDQEVRSKALILAMGISRAKLNVPGEKEFLGKGVSYCASCDAGFFRGKEVAVIGDGSEAAESAMLLLEYATKVYWISKAPDVSEHLMDKVKKTKVELISPSKPLKILGEGTVSGLELEGGRKLDVKGVFIALGAKGSMDLALELEILPDPEGHIPIDINGKTEMDMVYACGDVTGKPWQLARAVGQGCVAGDNAAAQVRTQRG